MLKDYANYDALGLAQLIKNKDISPSELLQTAIAQTEQQNPSINAVITKLYEHGQQQIEQGLRRMFVRTVSRVDDRALEHLGQQPRRTR